jgi:hypothetical protein
MSDFLFWSGWMSFARSRRRGAGVKIAVCFYARWGVDYIQGKQKTEGLRDGAAEISI